MTHSGKLTAENAEEEKKKLHWRTRLFQVWLLASWKIRFNFEFHYTLKTIYMIKGQIIWKKGAVFLNPAKSDGIFLRVR